MEYEKEYIIKRSVKTAKYLGPNIGYAISGEYNVISYDEETETLKYEKIDKIAATRISQFRKGLAVYLGGYYRNSIFSYTDAYIVNENKEVIYHTNEPFFYELYESNKIEDYHLLDRVFGGFYVSYRPGHFNPRTFPGSDRDTEYDIVPEIKEIITEDGRCLSPNEVNTFLLWHRILHYKEIENGIISVNGDKFNLSDYSKIDDLPY